MSGMRAHLASRLRSSSLNAAPPPRTSREYSVDLAKAATSILFRSPIPSKEGRPVYILNAAALPDSKEADFDSLLPYVLARLPEEDELVKGFEYEVVFFAGDGDGGATTKKNRPGWGWFLQAYHVLSRAMRKRLQKLYIVHEKAWVRILTEIFSTIVSPKFRRKIIHASTLTNLALHIPIENLLIPPSTYLHDRRISEDIFAPYASGRRAFTARQPFPAASNGGTRFPRILRETTSFLLMEENITVEGLFRVPPHSKLRDVLKEAYDRGQKYIVYKDNGSTLPLPPYPHAEHQDEIIAEVDPKDAYGVYMAAALIKAWYADLRQPIFPPTSYRDLKRLYGDPEDVPGLDRLTDLISPASDWSFLPAISREILVRHLLPLLDAIAQKQEQNKMTAENLAVCFAPALLCGPDQLEDAKMSSIVRRILTEAIELWPQGLKEACGQKGDDFREYLKLPTDEKDWEDPVEGKRGPTEERDSIDENQRTGVIPIDEEQRIILQDNEYLPAAVVPPPLPPRSRAASGRSSIESVTKRKPAPPLQVPPRYSTIVSDSPQDVAESPVNYAAITDGFAPRRDVDGPPIPARWNAQPDDKKSGTSNSVPVPAQWGAPDDKSSAPPQIILPKRKALTAEQIDNAEHAVAQVQARKASESSTTDQALIQRGMELPGLVNLNLNTSEPVRRKAVASGTFNGSETTSPESAVSAPASELKMSSPVNEFRRPSLPASANRTPNITSLARPVYPPTKPSAIPNAATKRPPSKSTSLPVPGPKPRTPSPGLLQRMPSFETRKTDTTESTRLQPKKLDLKKQSVDDLRRLYEERAGTAGILVEAGKHH